MKGKLFALTKSITDVQSNAIFDSMMKKVQETGAVVIDGGNIAANTISTLQIKAGSITATEIATDTITAGNIKTGAITADEIAIDAITATKIKAGEINANHIVAAGITADKIKTGTLNATNGVSWLNMNNGTFSLANGSIAYNGTSLNISANSITIQSVAVATTENVTTASDAAIVSARIASMKTVMLSEKNVFVAQKNDIDSQYSAARTKMTELTLTTEKTALETAYGTVSTRYLQKYNALIVALDAIINTADTTTITALNALDATVSSAVTAYTSELALLSTALSVAEQAINTKLADNALVSANGNTTTQIASAVPYNAVFTNENQSIITDVNGATKAVFVIATDIDAFRGSTRVAASIGTVTLKTTTGTAITYTGGTPTITKLDPTAGAKGWVNVSIPSGCTLSADVGYVDVPITMNGVLYSRKITWNKAKDGLNAKNITIGGAQTFSYDEYGVLKYPASTTLSVVKQNTVGSAYTWTYGINGAEPNIPLVASAGQVVFSGDTVQIFPTATIWGTADNLTIKAVLEGASDTITLYKIRDGISGTNLILETPDGVSFKDNSGNAKALNVKLIRNGEDVSGNATIRWYLNGVENVGLLNLKSMNIYPADVTSSLVIRIVATYLGTDYENSAVFIDLDDTYQVQIIGEDKIKNSQGNVTLTARVFRGANEITTGYRLRWSNVGQTPSVVLLEGSNTVDDRALTCVLTPAQINGSMDILCELSVDTVEAELEGTETSYVPSYDSRAYATAMSVALS